MTSYRKVRYYRDHESWRKWSKKSVNAKTMIIETLVIILGVDSIEEIFRYQLNLDMLQPLRFKRL